MLFCRSEEILSIREEGGIWLFRSSKSVSLHFAVITRKPEWSHTIQTFVVVKEYDLRCTRTATCSEKKKKALSYWVWNAAFFQETLIISKFKHHDTMKTYCTSQVVKFNRFEYKKDWLKEWSDIRWWTKKLQVLLPHRDTKLKIYKLEYLCEHSRDQSRSYSTQVILKPKRIPIKEVEKFAAFSTSIPALPMCSTVLSNQEKIPHTWALLQDGNKRIDHVSNILTCL